MAKCIKSLAVFFRSFLYFFFTYVRMSKDSSAKYYQENEKKALEKSLWKVSRFFWRKEKQKEGIW